MREKYLAFDTEGNLYSASFDKSVKVWDLKSLGTDTSVSVKGGTKVPLPKTFSEHSNAVTAIKPLESGRFVSAGEDKQIILYDGEKAIKHYTHTQNASIYRRE
ncbi:MAG: hypothetical protein NTY39_03835 [Campylobacterales bacterium]|nr:hypothetical protein [Campylobacterales bacterium]